MLTIACVYRLNMALRRIERATCMRLLQAAVSNTSSVTTRASSSATAYDHNDPRIKIGKREVVGFGYNGGLNYADRGDFPMPAIRFKEPNNEILVRRSTLSQLFDTILYSIYPIF